MDILKKKNSSTMIEGPPLFKTGKKKRKGIRL